MKKIIGISAAAALAMLCGCATTGAGKMSQAAIKNFETRTIDAPYEAVFAAATEALFDLGYIIQHSDKASGILTGEKRKTKSDFDIDFGIGTGRYGGIGADREQRQTIYNVSLLIKPAGEKTTDVRIKTSVDGEAHLVKEAIDEIWLYIDRQVLMESPPAAKPAKSAPASEPKKDAEPVSADELPKAQPVNDDTLPKALPVR